MGIISTGVSLLLLHARPVANRSNRDNLNGAIMQAACPENTTFVRWNSITVERRWLAKRWCCPLSPPQTRPGYPLGDCGVVAAPGHTGSHVESVAITELGQGHILLCITRRQIQTARSVFYGNYLDGYQAEGLIIIEVTTCQNGAEHNN
ncbi:hypothetical protein ACL7TT_10870 [Microbulbifer sp. 2304DJ12-6]|uniref:hypothetical protein n=1 Tax=Microbulbifer sp. 2304DJ12-6 TaxID=3233340 RepID=UPI0039B0553C